MNLTQLKYFVAAVKNKSITKAAATLYVSQPAISMAIKELEKEYGTKFFNIVDGQLVLTSHGNKFYNLSIKLLNSEKNFNDEIKSYIRESKEIIRIGIPPMIGSLLIPKLIEKEKEFKDEIEIEIMEIGSNFNERFLLENEIDFAIKGYYNAKKSNLINSFKIGESKIYFVTNINNSFNNTISLKQSISYPLILMKDDIMLSTIIQDYFKNENLEPNILLKTNQLKTIENALLTNKASAFSFKNIFLNNKNIKQIPLLEDVSFEFDVIWDKRKELEEYQKLFLKILEEIKIFD